MTKSTTNKNNNNNNKKILKEKKLCAKNNMKKVTEYETKMVESPFHTISASLVITKIKITSQCDFTYAIQIVKTLEA